ncbi:hypothetical protein MP228_012191 [Amoeboaphelidium protococcarum]|nr:hypothetical protein MP228_012191 [Amoeboaphelidium protococcarum]
MDFTFINNTAESVQQTFADKAPAPSKPRKQMTADQQMQLEHHFIKNPQASEDGLKQIAKEINMSVRSVKSWWRQKEMSQGTSRARSVSNPLQPAVVSSGQAKSGRKSSSGGEHRPRQNLFRKDDSFGKSTKTNMFIFNPDAIYDTSVSKVQKEKKSAAALGNMSRPCTPEPEFVMPGKFLPHNNKSSKSTRSAAGIKRRFTVSSGAVPPSPAAKWDFKVNMNENRVHSDSKTVIKRRHSISEQQPTYSTAFNILPDQNSLLLMNFQDTFIDYAGQQQMLQNVQLQYDQQWCYNSKSPDVNLNPIVEEDLSPMLKSLKFDPMDYLNLN